MPSALVTAGPGCMFNEPSLRLYGRSITPTKDLQMASINHWKSRTLLLIAAAIVVVCMFVPYGYLAVYPFRLFGTFIHETGHAVATLITGGQVLGMEVNLDTSGLAKRRGGAGPIVASAGYLGSIIAGAALLYAGRYRKWARPTLTVVGGATLLATALFGGFGQSLIAFFVFSLGAGLVAVSGMRLSESRVRTPLNFVGGALILVSLAYVWFIGGLLTWAIGLFMGGALLVVAAYASPFIRHLTVLFLGVQISLDGLQSVQSLFYLTSAGHSHNDAQSMAEYTGIPAEFWALSWGVLGILVVAGAFWLFWRQNGPNSPSN